MKLRQAIKIAKSVCAKKYWNWGYDDVVREKEFAVSYNKYQQEKALEKLCKLPRWNYVDYNRALNARLREEMGA